MQGIKKEINIEKQHDRKTNGRIARKPHVEVLYKATTAGLKDLPRKVAMVLAKGTLDFAKKSIVSYGSFTYFQKHFCSCSPQTCFQACSKAKGLQVFLRDRLSFRILT